MRNHRSIAVAALMFGVLCGAGIGQQTEVPGDRMRLDWFAYDREAHTARWQMTLGALDANGEFQPSSGKQTCALRFAEFEYGCEGRWATLDPAAYANAGIELNYMLEHAYHLMIVIEQARQQEKQAER